MAENQLPASIQGDGRKFISLLKSYLADLKEQITSLFDEVTGMDNVINDTPTTIDEQVHSITVEEKSVNGNISLFLKWNVDQIKKYNGAIIKIKESKNFAENNWDDIEWSRTYETTKTKSYTVENCSAGTNYLIQIQAKDITNAVSVESQAPRAIYYISENNHAPRPPYEFTVVFDKRGCYWSWKQYDQNEYMWTELRLDEHVGEEHNRLDITTDWKSDAIPNVRQGTAYLYNKGIGNAYSAPVKLEYNLGVLPAPRHLKVTPVFEGLQIEFDELPDTANGTHIYINNEKNVSKTNNFTYLCSTGTYKIKVAYVDVFGEGEMSEEITMSTEEEIPPNAVHITEETVFDNGVIIGKYIGDRQIVGTKIKEDSIGTGHIQANAIVAGKIATNAVTTNNIQAGAIKTEHMEVNSIEGDRIKAKSLSADQIKAGSITGDELAVGSISGDKILANSITGEKIQANAITSDKIKSRSITGDKIVADNLSSISALIGILRTRDYGARVEIRDNLIQVFDEYGRLRVRIGVW